MIRLSVSQAKALFGKGASHSGTRPKKRPTTFREILPPTRVAFEFRTDLPPLSIGQNRLGRDLAAAYGQREKFRAHVREEIAAAQPPGSLLLARLVLTFVVPNRARRDLTNAVAAWCKPGCDALVDQGLLVDDDWRYLSSVQGTMRHAKPGERAGTIVRLEPLEEAYGDT